MSEENKAIARRALEVFNTGNLGELDEIVSEDAVDHDPQNPFAGTHGPEAAKQMAATYRAAFPDLHVTIEDQIAEGDKVVTRWTAVGTHDGDLPGLPASGRSSTVTGIGIDRIQDGRIVEAWGNWDTMGMMQQLGAIPAATTAS